MIEQPIYIDKVVSKLDDVLIYSYDSIKGYKHAAQEVKSLSLKAFFNDQIADRSKFARELAELIKAYGSTPSEEGSLKGKLHRTWMDFKSAVTSGNDDAILNECIRGEEHASQDYDELLKMELPNDTQIRTLITEHKMQINQAIQRLKALERVS